MGEFTAAEMADAERFVRKVLGRCTRRQMTDYDLRDVAAKVLRACRFQTTPTNEAGRPHRSRLSSDR